MKHQTDAYHIQSIDLCLLALQETISLRHYITDNRNTPRYYLKTVVESESEGPILHVKSLSTFHQ